MDQEYNDVHEEQGSADRKQNHPLKTEVKEWGKALVIAAILVLVIRWFIFAPFIVDGPSMHPNFFTGEKLIVNKFIYDLRKPHRGEVIVFQATAEKDFIKRVIGLPGDTVEVDGDKVYINDELLDEPYIKEKEEQAAENGTSYNSRNYPKTTVPEGSIFVMGDNRSNSMDSRDIGFVTYNKIIGRADLIFWPLNKISFIHL